MAIPEGKERRQITLTLRSWEKLDKKLAKEKQKYRHWNVGHVTVSKIIEEMVYNDKMDI